MRFRMANRILAISFFLTSLTLLAETPRFSMEVPDWSGSPFSALDGGRFQKGSGNIVISSNGRAFLWDDRSAFPRPVDLPLLDENGLGIGSVQCASGVEVTIF